MIRAETIIRILACTPERTPVETLVTTFEAAVLSYGFEAYVLLRHSAGMEATPVGRCLMPEIGPVATLPAAIVEYARGAEGGFRIRDMPPQPKRARRPRGGAKVEAGPPPWRDGYVFPVHTGRGFAGTLALTGAIALSALDILLWETVARHLLRSAAGSGEDERASSFSITRREREALTFLADGLTSNEIARMMSISSHTVDWYVNGLQDKLSARNRHHLVAVAFRSGLCG